MPWPVTHILIAEKVYAQYFHHLDRKPFLLGTSFPDIRYPAKLSRNQTHLYHSSFQEIQSQDAFSAGMMFHNFVDNLWINYTIKDLSGMFKAISLNPPMLHAMKVLQDGYLYYRYKAWPGIVKHFETILPEEGLFCPDDKMVERWHEVLTYYLSKQPNIHDLEMLEISLPAELIEEIKYCYMEFSGNAAIKSSMSGFYDQIDTMIQDAQS